MAQRHPGKVRQTVVCGACHRQGDSLKISFSAASVLHKYRLSVWTDLVVVCIGRAGWVECWTVPSVMLTIDYTWHPIYPQKADEQLKQSCKCFEYHSFLNNCCFSKTLLKIQKLKLTDRCVFSDTYEFVSFNYFWIIIDNFYEHLPCTKTWIKQFSYLLCHLTLIMPSVTWII